MKEQIKVANEIEPDMKRLFSSSKRISLTSTLIFIASSILSVAGIMSGLGSIILISTFGFLTTFATLIKKCSKSIITDIEKNRIFLHNETDLNRYIKSNPNVLSRTSNKTKKMIQSTPENKPIFTINSIDKMKYEELKGSIDDIKREEQFGFDYSNAQDDKNATATWYLVKKRDK